MSKPQNSKLTRFHRLMEDSELWKHRAAEYLQMAKRFKTVQGKLKAMEGYHRCLRDAKDRLKEAEQYR